MHDVCLRLESGREERTGQKSSLRLWVRDFVWLRNRTRGHGAPKGDTLATVCPELRASLDEILNHAPTFQRPWAHLRRNLTGKYRVTSFGRDRVPFEYLTTEDDHSMPDGTYVFLDRPRRAKLLWTDPELTDFFLPNGNFRKQSFEALSYLTDERATRDGAGYVAPATSQPVSETSATPDLDVVGEVFSNMPPRRDGYVSRSLLESELTALLDDDRHPVITLQGRGGIGKTSLALEVLHDVARDGNVFAIVWFSARDIDLLAEGPKIVRADVLSIEDISRDFMRLMQPDGTTRAADSTRYLTDCLSGVASDGPFIFVVDNFETIRDQSGLYAYLSNAVRLPNKVLITTRTRDFKADYPVEVGGMQRSEYGHLVQDVSTKLGVRHLIDAGYESQLYDESNGHPYITKVLIGEVAHAATPVPLKRIVASKDALLDALFERSYASLSPAGQRVFLTLCGWRSLVPRIGLIAVLLRPGSERLDVERALTELEQSSLIEVIQFEGDTSADFLSVPLAAASFGKRKLVTSPHKIAVDTDLELIKRFGAATTTDLGQGLGPRILRVVRAAAKTASEGANIDEELAVIEYIATEYHPAWLDLAELYQELGDVPAAIQAMNRYLEVQPQSAEGWRRVIRLYRSANDPVAEMHARLQLAELEDSTLDELSSSASRLNGLLYRNELELDDDARRLLVGRFRSMMEMRSREADATDLSRLAWLCMNDKDQQAATQWATAGLAQDPENEHCRKLMTRIANG